MEVDGKTLSAAQEKRFKRIEKGMKSSGASDPLAATERVWHMLYRLEGSVWERKAVPVTSRGFSFAQRPDER